MSLLPRAVNFESYNLNYAGLRLENLGTKILETIFALVLVVVSVKRSSCYLLGGVLMGEIFIIVILNFSYSGYMC